MPTVAGIDIAGGQWAVVELSWNEDDPPQLAGETVDYGELQIANGWLLSVIDVPVGLFQDHEAAVSDKGRTGDRPVDRGARKWCRSTSSVFPSPTEGQLSSGMDEHNRAAASQNKSERKRKLSAVRLGGLSQQTFELLPAIDDARRVKALHSNRVFESHPEVAFSVIATGVVPLSKASLAGALMRVKLLSDRLGLNVLEWVLAKEGNTEIAADNWIDAVVLALVAMDWVRDADQRKVLCDASGNVTNWDGNQRDFLMAMPNTTLTLPPGRIGVGMAIQGIRNWLADF